jgi:hypothetical protein
MKFVFFAAFVVGIATGSPLVELPPSGQVLAEAILNCEVQVAKLEGIQKAGDATVNGYVKLNRGADSFVYFFTGPSEAAHPSMIAITLHPMRDPLRPQKEEIEFHESYASSEEQFVAWRKRVLFEFGRGFATGAYEAARKESAGNVQ